MQDIEKTSPLKLFTNVFCVGAVQVCSTDGATSFALLAEITAENVQKLKI